MPCIILGMASSHLPGIFNTVAPVLDHYGYAAVAGCLLLENFGVPLPGETILIAAAIYAGAGKLNIVIIWIVAVVASVIGDNIGFAIGHYGGERFVTKYGRYIFLSEKRLLAAQDFFNKNGGLVVTVARFIAGLRQLNGIVAGTAHMKWPTFIVFNIIGAALWVSVWSGVGYLAGNHIDVLYNQLRHFETAALVIIAILVIGHFALKIRRKS